MEFHFSFQFWQQFYLLQTELTITTFRDKAFMLMFRVVSLQQSRFGIVML